MDSMISNTLFRHRASHPTTKPLLHDSGPRIDHARRGNQLIGPYCRFVAILGCSALLRPDGLAQTISWEDRFGAPGTENTVESMAKVNNDLYLGGNLSTAGNTSASGIVRWDGTTWHSLGEGLRGSAHALLRKGDSLFVAGTFGQAGNVTAMNIAIWNTKTEAWSHLDSSATNGTNGEIFALAWLHGRLVVGGQFSIAGGIPARNLAQWDGSTWSPMGNGVNRYVTSLFSYGSRLYVGGTFDSAGTIAAAHIVAWDDSTSNWVTLGSGVDGDVNAIVANGTSVIIGGGFRNAGVVAASCIAQWNGSTWSSFAEGMNFGVSALAYVNGYLVAGGYFSTAGNDYFASHLALWDAGEWHHIQGGSPGGAILSLVPDGPDLYVAGGFTQVGAVAAWNICRWSSGVWHSLSDAHGNGLNAAAWASLPTDSGVIAGGEFTTCGDITVGNIATWNGHRWQALGPGIGAWVHAIENINGDIYAASDVGLSRWNGASWDWVGTAGPGSPNVSAIGRFGGDVIVAGEFGFVDYVWATNIARWDGNQWYPLGDGLNGHVGALAGNDTSLYAAGWFDGPGTPPLNNVAQWNGVAWAPMGNGLGRPVNALLLAHDGLYAGNYYGIYKWTGSGWSTEIEPGQVHCLREYGDTLIAGGDFGVAIKVSGNWTTFRDIGQVFSVSFWKSMIFATGWFYSAGNTTSLAFAAGDLNTTSVQRERQAPLEAQTILAFPNPFNSHTIISYELTRNDNAILTVYDILGREIRRVLQGFQTAGPHKIYLDGSGLSSGVYFCTLQTSTTRSTLKLMMIR